MILMVIETETLNRLGIFFKQDLGMETQLGDVVFLLTTGAGSADSTYRCVRRKDARQ